MLSKAQPSQARPIANLQGLALLTLTTAVEATFSPDRDYWLSELRFTNDTNATWGNNTIKLTIGGQTLFGGSACPLALLQDRAAANSQGSAANGSIVFKLPQPVPVSRANPLKMTATFASGAMTCLVVALDPSAV